MQTVVSCVENKKRTILASQRKNFISVKSKAFVQKSSSDKSWVVVEVWEYVFCRGQLGLDNIELPQHASPCWSVPSGANDAITVWVVQARMKSTIFLIIINFAQTYGKRRRMCSIPCEWVDAWWVFVPWDAGEQACSAWQDDVTFYTFQCWRKRACFNLAFGLSWGWCCTNDSNHNAQDNLRRGKNRLNQ